ncbi:hypothetical protein D3C76_1199130 [compost metagenome]
MPTPCWHYLLGRGVEGPLNEYPFCRNALTRNPGRNGRGFFIPLPNSLMTRNVKMLLIPPAKRTDAEAAFDIRLQAIRHQYISVYTAEQVRAWTDVPLTERYRAWVKKEYHVALLSDIPSE